MSQLVASAVLVPVRKNYTGSGKQLKTQFKSGICGVIKQPALQVLF